MKTPMNAASALILAASLLAPAVAVAAPPAPARRAACDNQGLIDALGRVRGGSGWLVVRGQGEASLRRTPTAKGTSPGLGEAALRVTCDAIELPIATKLERPTRGPAKTLTDGGLVVAKTARGVISLDFDAGLADPEALHLTLSDDESVSVVRGEALVYASATLADGSLVTTEGRGFGCGCETTRTPDGHVSVKPLR